jgi:hypothetical protein
MLKKAIKFFILFLLFARIANAQLAISSVTPTESTCQANGTLTITASGGTGPYQYEITQGPVGLTLPPAQSPSNVFNALPAGTYSIKVSDLGVDGPPFVTQTGIVVPGTYVAPVLTGSPTSPTCFNSTDGKIVGNVTGGILPYTFELVSPSVSTAGPQASETFGNLAAGDYSLRLTDGCGNIQTRVVTIEAAGGNLGEGSLVQSLTKTGCDVFGVGLTFYGIPVKEFKPPYTIKYTTTNGTGDDVTETLPLTVDQTATYSTFQVSGYNTTLSYTVTNGCGTEVTNNSFTVKRGIFVQGFTLDCKAAYQVYMTDYYGSHLQLQMFYKAPVTYQLINTDTNLEVASQIDNPVFKDFPTGNYKVVLTDACGTTDEDNFVWETVGEPVLYFFKRTDSCLDNTAVVGVGITNSKLLSVTVLSGPATASSTKSGYEYTKSYTYPFSLTLNSGDGNGPAALYGDFAPGDYLVEVTHTCGDPIQKIVTVLQSDVADYIHSFTYTQGCANANKLHFTGRQSNGNSYSGHSYTITNSANTVVGTGGGYTIDDTYNNLPSDTYKVSYSIGQVWPSVLSCDVVHEETLIIPPYSQPDIKLITNALCGPTSYAIAQPDPLKGAGPYTYAIRSQGEPAFGALQSNPDFAIAVPGVYDIQMIDACGNSTTKSVSMGTVTLPAPTKTGTGCIGSTDTQISMPLNPAYTYTWTRPNNTTYTGNVLTINPVTAGDIGTYGLAITSNVTGCTSTTNTSFSLSSSCVLPVKLISFKVDKSEQNVLLTWETAIEEAMDGYGIERSTNARNFESIGFIKSSNVIQRKYWSYVDKNVEIPQSYYYRLKMINLDGTFAYSTMRAVTLGSPDQALRVFSNPVGSGQTKLKLPKAMEAELLRINVFNINGRILKNEKVQATGSILEMDYLSSLKSGTYLIRVESASGNSNTVKFIVP